MHLPQKLDHYAKMRPKPVSVGANHLPSPPRPQEHVCGGPAEPRAVELPECDAVLTWWECELCGKWRKAQGGTGAGPAPAGFACADNWDARYQNCAAPQEGGE